MSRGASRLTRGHAAARRCPAFSSSCTSPLVERRDPLGVGLRPGCGVWRVAGNTARRQTLGRPAGCPAVHARYQAAALTYARVRRGRRKRAPRYTEAYGPSAVTGPGPLLVVRLTFDRPANVPRGNSGDRYRSATLLLWVLLGPVLKHGPRSLTCTRVIGIIDT